MGRKKSYSREEAAERALQTFWEKGFERTSIRDLEASTGVNRYGLYDSFTDKQGLFRECIEHYCSSGETMLDELAPQGLDGLVDLIGRFGEAASDDNNTRYGCLAVTSLLERESLAPEVRERLEAWVRYLLEHIGRVLEQEQQAGTLRADLPLDECVEFVHMALIGLPTMCRISSDDSGMRLAAKAAVRTMQSWRV